MSSHDFRGSTHVEEVGEDSSQAVHRVKHLLSAVLVTNLVLSFVSHLISVLTITL